jgi:hypothetical protein
MKLAQETAGPIAMLPVLDAPEAAYPASLTAHPEL